MTDSRGWLTSPWLHGVCLALLSLAVLLRYGPNEMPFFGDRGYFTYLGQSVLRGETIYQVSFMGYPPLVPMLTAGAMQLGSWFGVPTYLAPRYLAMGFAVISVALTLVVTRHASGSPWAGWAAAATLAGSSLVGWLGVSALEPKLMVVLFGLVSSVAMQRRSWFGAGLGAGLAGMCWQPAVLVALCSFAVTLSGGRRAPIRAIGAYAAGMTLALLPAVLYLSVTDSWWAFFQRSIVIPATLQLPGAASTPMLWVSVLWRDFGSERVFAVAAAAGLLLFALRSSERGLRGLVSRWLDPDLGGLPLLSIAWLLFCSIEFQGLPDLVPLIAIQAFWTGWLVDWAIRRGSSALPRVANRRAGIALASVLLIALTLYSVADAPKRLFGITLQDQQAAVRNLTRDLAADDGVIAFHATELLVLDDRPSAARFLRPIDGFLDFAWLLGADGCIGAMRRLVAEEPGLVVLRRVRTSSPCPQYFEAALIEAGYDHQRVQFGGRGVPGYPLYKIVWQVYRRPESARE